MQDLKIADRVLQEGRALIIALNKWDVAENASSLFNGVKGALDEGLAQVKGVPLLTVSAATGKGHRHADRRCLRDARGLVAPHLHRPAQSLVRARDRSEPAARARRQADQAALCHAEQDASAELRPVRHAASISCR